MNEAEQANKALVTDAFHTLFNERDYEASTGNNVYAISGGTLLVARLHPAQRSHRAWT